MMSAYRKSIGMTCLPGETVVPVGKIVYYYITTQFLKIL